MLLGHLIERLAGMALGLTSTRRSRPRIIYTLPLSQTHKYGFKSSSSSSPGELLGSVDTVPSSCFSCWISQILTAFFSAVWLLYNSSKEYFIALCLTGQLDTCRLECNFNIFFSFLEYATAWKYSAYSLRLIARSEFRILTWVTLNQAAELPSSHVLVDIPSP